MSMDAFVFPGQGSQFPGMGKDLADNFPSAKAVFAEANDALGFDLAALCFNGPEEALRLTTNTQPAILTVSIAALRALEHEAGLRPGCAAGHSLGEYSALVCAGALSFADAVRIVRQRGAFMQEAVPVGTGAMAAIMGLEGEALDEVCRQAAQGEIVSPANFNCAGQVVIAGHAGAVDRAIELAKAKGAKRGLLLPVSAPFHCALMTPAGDRLQKVLDGVTVSPLRVPVVTNVEAAPNSDATRVGELLVTQVSAPVRWEESVQRMAELGVSRYVEIGPGKVLANLIKRIVKGAETANVEDTAGVRALVK
ncbi:MAG: [acyl-carrier-protein] S-malonyltransferase [Desulfuromonadales bacterium GWD2_61_12]|nr:MAG: [acyl-carrier-protein] S-malonyltransferase [Desulfuromonadales bacterium GWC2_61_20]OGR35373.1 MAG: [acyl-carrier-protein] S-malonyltransferase [Desulfuromonadales bacterium GWD2_61_12]HAD05420.1 [acyl-carrier-protein] S-malonyltransferase [Desulfuromonas sp.]HBT83934.1 [acyl-carrier-protein] S-malonyltransferase [Desulfuromonas sp.]